MYDNNQLAQPCTSGLVNVRETIKEGLNRQRAEVEAHLANIDNALKFLNDNPNFEAFYNTLRKAGY